MALAEAICPHCKLAMDIPRDLRGKEIECPQCEKPFTPEAEAPPPIETREPTAGVATCPFCQVAMDVPADLAGEEVECPECRKAFLPKIDSDAPPPRRRWERFEDDYDDRLSPEQLSKIASARLRPAAITLMVSAIVRMIVMGIISIFGGWRLFERGANGGDVVLFSITAIIFLKESFTVYGAWLMLNARSYGWGLAASILMLIPTADFCCLLFWLPFLGFGIWAIVAINDTDVRWLIRQRQKSERTMDRNDP